MCNEYRNIFEGFLHSHMMGRGRYDFNALRSAAAPIHDGFVLRDRPGKRKRQTISIVCLYNRSNQNNGKQARESKKAPTRSSPSALPLLLFLFLLHFSRTPNFSILSKSFPPTHFNVDGLFSHVALDDPSSQSPCYQELYTARMGIGMPSSKLESVFAGVFAGLLCICRLGRSC